MAGHTGCWGWKVTRSWQGGGSGQRDRKPTVKVVVPTSPHPKLPSSCHSSCVVCAVAGVGARPFRPSCGANPSKVGGREETESGLRTSALVSYLFSHTFLKLPTLCSPGLTLVGSSSWFWMRRPGGRVQALSFFGTRDATLNL